MRDYKEYKVDYNEIKLRNGEKIFLKQLEGLQGEDVIINNSSIPTRALILNVENINNEKNEFRTLCVKKDVELKHGSQILYKGENYLVVTDIDDHYYYKNCKIKKCNNILKWKDKDDNIHELPCLLNNDSYGVKVLSDNDYIRTQNIKAQIVVQDNEFTRAIIPDMRFMFNHSEFDIYNIIDVNRSITKGLITFTSEKSVLQMEDNLKENLAFSRVLYEDKVQPTPTPPTYSYSIDGSDSFKQESDCVYSINPLTNCTFYIEEFDKNNIAFIVSDNGNGTCTIHGKENMCDNWFTLYAKDVTGNILTSKEINVIK